MQLEDGHTLFDYDVGLNVLIQLMIRVKPAAAAETATLSTSAKAQPKDGAEENISDKENNEVYPAGAERNYLNCINIITHKIIHNG